MTSPIARLPFGSGPGAFYHNSVATADALETTSNLLRGTKEESQ